MIRDAALSLQRLPGVASVEETDDAEGAALLVFPREGRAILGEVTDLVRTAGWPIRTLRVERGRLDDVFRSITAAEDAMHGTLVIFRRELASYFATPLAYVFIVIFLVMAGATAFFVGNFFDRGQADLLPFFSYHPWLYLVLIPALSMRLWAEERKSGTIELFLTLPISVWEAVLGKFLAAWAFTGIALVLTFPFWITVNVLGSPDNGVILASYLGSFLMAGAFLALGAALSALTKSQVIAFVMTAAVCFLFTVTGLPVLLEFLAGWAPHRSARRRFRFQFPRPFQRHPARRHPARRRGVLRLRDRIGPVRQRDFRRTQEGGLRP